MSAGLYALAAGACSDLSFCPSYRNSKIQIRVEVTQSEDGNFLKAPLFEHDRTTTHKLKLCHKYPVCFLLLLQLSVNKCSSSWI